MPLDQLAPRIAERKEQVDRLKARLSELEIALAGQKVEPATLEEVRECASDLRALLEAGTIAERRSFVKSFVKELGINGDEARLSYTLPMLPTKVAEEGIPVLGIVQRGGR